MSDDTAGTETVGEGYDPAQDPDSDPEMLTTKHPDQQGENERDPAEGAEEPGTDD